jgi:hypothetical protein
MQAQVHEVLKRRLGWARAIFRSQLSALEVRGSMSVRVSEGRCGHAVVVDGRSAQGNVLHRALTFRDLVIYGMVFMLPTAPFSLFGIVHRASNGHVPLAYLLKERAIWSHLAVPAVGLVITMILLSAMRTATLILGASWLAVGVGYLIVMRLVLHRSVSLET